MIENLCIIEIGSNAVRAQFSKIKKNSYEYNERIRYQVRLGEDVFKLGFISEEKKEKLLTSFLQILFECSQRNTETIIAIGTSALRNASNRREIIHYIKRKTDVPIHFIPGKEEAYWVHQAVNNLTPLSDKRSLLVDIGGGSTELIVHKNNKVQRLESFPVGTVRCLRYRTLEKMEEFIDHELENVSDFLSETGCHESCNSVIGIGGSLRRIGKLGKTLFQNKLATQISVSQVEEIYKILNKLTYQERIQYLGLREDRADVLIPAIYLILNILWETDCKKLRVPRISVSDGLCTLLARTSLTSEEKKMRKELIQHYSFQPKEHVPKALKAYL